MWSGPALFTSSAEHLPVKSLGMLRIQRFKGFLIFKFQETEEDKSLLPFVETATADIGR